MKKNFLLLAAICTIGLKSFGQYAYGLQWTGFPPSFKIGTGFYSNNPAQNFSLEYVTNVLPNNFFWWSNVNFWIQSPGGQFQGAYYIYDGPAGCAGPLNQVLNGSGMSAVESNVGTSYRFAIAGAYTKGCYFLTIDAFGNPVSTMQYLWPSQVAAGTLAKPSITEDSNGDFYISGPYNNDMYVIKVNSTGGIIWSSFYSNGPNGISCKDIIVNPYNPNNLIVVGKSTNASLDQNGFIMEIDGISGGILNSKEFGYPSNREYFNTVIAGSYVNSLNPQGFVIGGLNKGNGAPGISESWVLKIDQNWNLIWSNRVQSSLDPQAGEVVDVIERLNTLNNYEYFALTQSNVGMLVYKLDDSGMPFPYLAPNAIYNEYAYSSGGTVFGPTSISYVNNPSSINNGLHVYGTSDQFGWPGLLSRLYVHSYFNGENSCASISSNCSFGPCITIQNNFNPMVTAGPTSCNNFAINYVPGGVGCNLWCNNFVSAGSNQKTANNSIPADPYPTERVNLFNETLKVSTSPNQDKIFIKYKSNENSPIKIDLYNVLGQYIKTLESTTQGPSGSFTVEADLKKLNLERGVYIIDANINGTKHREKFIYED